MAEYLIGSLDDDGLLRKPLSTIAEEMAIYQGIDATEDELRHSLAVIQGFDPAGIGARSLQECLLLQIRRKPDSPLKKVELNIVEKCLEDFTRKNKDKVMQRLGISEETYAKAVSELAKLDISTVSRVSNSKYAQTNFGLFPLKFFFITGFKRNEADDEKLSSYEIKRILQECVDEEDKTAPLTDDELAASLQEKGYPVARRTVAKYRLQLNIPIARLRRN